MRKFSIIIPVYNIENYLRKCLDSIINQTYENLEIIIVDDGSTDNSYSICQEYQKKDSRIKLIRQKNKGLSGARNTGFANSTGDFIWFIDGDDYIENDSVNVIASYFDDYDIIVFNFKEIKGCKELKRNDLKAYDDVKRKYMLSYIMAWNKVFKRDILVGESFLEGYIHEDICLIPTLALKTDKIVFLNEYLYNYVYREGSITNSGFKLDDKLHVLSHLGKKLGPKYKDELELLYINNLVMPSIVDKVTKNHKYNFNQINMIMKENFPRYYNNKYLVKWGLLRKLFIYFFYHRIYVIPVVITYLKYKMIDLKFRKIE